jgi:low temperature requirement protein LtrA
MKFRKDIIKRPELLSELNKDEERHADWLELLYDLVLVAAVSQLAFFESANYSLIGFLGSIPLFFVIWWGWVGHTFYLSRFGTNDVFHRIFTFAQMLAIGGLAVTVKYAWSVNGAGFALSYAVLRFMLVAEYLRAGRYIPEARILTNHYVLGFGVAAIIWLTSVFVPVPWRFGLWGIALIVDILTPISAGEKHVKIPVHSTHIPERFGLLTIIVIGETIVLIIYKIGLLGLTFNTAIIGLMGLIIAFSVWWNYFEESRGAEAKVIEAGNQMTKYQVWLYSHFPLLLGFVTVGAGIGNILTLNLWQPFTTEGVWILCISVAITFIALSTIFLSAFSLDYCKNRILQVFRLPYYIIIILMICTGFLGTIISGSMILLILTLLCILTIFISLREPPEEAVCKL